MNAQGVGTPLNMDTYHIVDRLDIKTGFDNPIHTSLKYYLRGDVTRFAIGVDTSLERLTIKDRRDLYYIFRDNNEWLEGTEEVQTTEANDDQSEKVFVDSTNTFYTFEPNRIAETKGSDYYIESKRPILKYFYKTPANLLEGGIDDKVYFYSEIQETQAGFTKYINDRIIRDKAVPGAGLFKNYKSSISDKIRGYDYLNAQGYFGLNVSKHVGLQLGHGRNFIGNGYRSLLLSDFGANYFYLKLNTNVWRFHYQNIFAELSAEGGRDQTGNLLVPKKYFAAHYLSYKFSKNFSVGLFESIIFSRQNHFELQYLNPIILYRSVEHAIGSPDNAMIGMDFKWNFLKRFSLYGQLLIDEFLFKEVVSDRNGWWANKNGVQLGLKYIDVLGVDHLDAQFEFNTVRPYTYTHRDSLSTSNYVHYNQALAHPLGANFKEFIFKLRYQPTKKFVIEARFINMDYGADSDSVFWGNNLLLDYRNRFSDYGNETGQGIATNTQILGLDLSYQVFHNMYIDLEYFYRNQNSEIDLFDLKTNYFGGGVRVNIGKRKNDF